MVEEEKPVGTGGVSEEVGEVLEEKKDYKKVFVEEETGRRFKYSSLRYGGKRYICKLESCVRFCMQDSDLCRRHGRLTTDQRVDVKREIKLIQRFIRNTLNTAQSKDPRLYTKLQDLEASVKALEEKIQGMITVEALQQLGYYFGSILFQYITDGSRYEMAKKDYLDAISKAGCFTVEEVNALAKHSADATPVS